MLKQPKFNIVRTTDISGRVSTDGPMLPKINAGEGPGTCSYILQVELDDLRDCAN